MNNLSDSDFLVEIRKRGQIWFKDRKINPLKADIDIQSIWVKDGETDVSCVVSLRYNYLIRILMLPLYILSGVSGRFELMDWAEDVSYFKCLTQRGMQRKRDRLNETRERICSLVAEAYNKREV